MSIGMRIPQGVVIGSSLAVNKLNMLLSPPTPAPVGNSVNRDGPSNWYVPQTSADFIALGLAVPDYLYLMQEASGNLASTIGSLSFVASATGHLYQQTVPGWTRKFIGTDGVTSDQAWRTTNAALDVALGESYATIVYCSHTAAAKTIITTQGANNRLVGTTTTGLVRTLHNNVSTSGAIDHSGITTVRQLCWFRNGTSNISGAETDLESIVATHDETALSGQVKTVGVTGNTAAIAARYTWMAIFKGTNAEQNWNNYLAVLRG